MLLGLGGVLVQSRPSVAARCCAAQSRAQRPAGTRLPASGPGPRQAPRDPEAAGLDLAPLIAWGASPRATLALTQLSRARALMRGRAFVIPEDIKAVGMEIMRHRILITYEAEAENLTSDDIVTSLLDNIEVP